MTVQTTTDADEILSLLEPVLIADPVRNTIFGSVRAYLRRNRDEGWCARAAGALAARSSTSHPVALTAGWTEVGSLADAIAALPGLTGIGGPTDTVEAIVGRLDREPTHRVDERLFRLDHLVVPVGVPGHARLATENDIGLLAGWFIAFALEVHGYVPSHFDADDQVRIGIRQRRPWVWQRPDATPVSMAVRHPPVAGVARIGPVFTPREHRGHGYGSAVTARAAFDILDSAALPVLYTDRANPTSNKIYRAIGFYPVADRASVAFT
jgi:GNAT superfamily N-acetyltransferase